MHTCISSHGLKRSWRSCPRRVNAGNKNTPSTHHPQRRNVTTLMVGLKNGHIRKNLTQKVVNPRDIAGERKKNKTKQNKKQKNKKLSLLCVAVPQRWSGTLLLLVDCVSSQQHASVSQGRICSDFCTCCHTEIEAAYQTFYLTQSQYTDTGPPSPRADPIMPGARQASHWSTLKKKKKKKKVTGMTRPGKIPRRKRDSNARSSALEPTRRYRSGARQLSQGTCWWM